MQLSVKNAAELAEQSYLIADRIKRGRVPPEVKAHINRKGAQAYMMKRGVLVVPGSNELLDWFRNFDIYRIMGRNYRRDERGKGRTGAVFHAGFLRHATTLYAFAKENNAQYVIGHSLGAATAQILGTSLGIPAVGFASPRVKRGRRKLKNESKVLNICRMDDLVTRLPPSEAGFRRLGLSVRMTPAVTNPGLDHSMTHYLQALDDHVGAPGLPKRWPA